MKIKHVVIIIVVAVVAIGCLMVMSLLPTGNSNGNGNNSSTTSTNNIDLPENLVGLRDPEVAAKFTLAAIKSDDTVSVIDPAAQAEIILRLDRKFWKSPQWSPDGKLLAVLGSERQGSQGQRIFDIFIFDLAKGEWLRATEYSSGDDGVDSFQWFSETRIVYTQGTADNRWLHRFDYTNQEIQKEFRVAGELEFIQPGKQRFVFSQSGTYIIYGFNGKELIRFTGGEIGGDTEISKVVSANLSDKYVVEVQGSNLRRVYVWDFNNPEFEELWVVGANAQTNDSSTASASASASGSSLIPICMLEDSLLWVLEMNPELKIAAVRTYNIDNGDLGDRISVDIDFAKINSQFPEVNADCTKEKGTLLKVTELTGAGEPLPSTRWYVAYLEELRLQLVRLATDYPELDIK